MGLVGTLKNWWGNDILMDEQIKGLSQVNASAVQKERKKTGTKQIEYCALCGLHIDGKPIVREFDGEEKLFCCQGCERVYDIAREQGMLDQVISRPEVKHENIRDLVFDPGETEYFSLQGMWCAGCAISAEQVLRRTPGVKSADVSFAAERGRLQYDPKQVDATELLKSLDNLGYKARSLVDPSQQVIERNQERTLIQLITAVAFGMQVMIIYLVQLYPRYALGEYANQDVRKLQYMVWALATPILLFGGLSFLKGAWRAMLAGTATMDTLVALGILSAYSYSVYITIHGGGEVYFDTVAMITTFVMTGRYLETLGGVRARKDIRKLLKLQPDQGWKWVNGDWQQVNALKLVPGDRILIKPGERVPVDAMIEEGEAALNEAMLTGESIPVNKGPGEEIYAGTLVSDEAIIARTLKSSTDTRLSQISKLVDETLSTKPPIQRLVDRASTYFAVGIILTAVLTLLGWWLVTASFSESILTAVAVLVVACPCALGLATPLALAVTLGRTTKVGVLLRNPIVLETAAKLQRLVFDKTGTLTKGEMSVVAVVAASELSINEKQLLRIAAGVEQFSEHPIAKAILKFYKSSDGGELPKAQEFQTLRGFGAMARVEGFDQNKVLVGSELLLEVDHGSIWNDRAREYTSHGDTIAWVGWEKQVAGFIAVRDVPNDTAREALRELKQRGIKTAILSGDHPDTTAAVARDFGLQDYSGNCPPSQKAEKIKNWQQAGEQVGMVGDGVNDAPALAQADISFAMAGGTDIAGETSDVLLMNSDLTVISWFLDQSKRTRRIILENLGWAFAYNIVAIPLAILGVISPVIAAATMATSSILVVGNSLRLRK
jgi:heavy metal translocating P-type ATPase